MNSSALRLVAYPSLASGLFVASLGVLLLEIALTRIFSFTIWYHFAYLTISVALLGFGSAGSLLATFPSLMTDPARLLGRACLVAAGGVILVLLVVSTIPLDPVSVLRERRQFANLIIYYAVVTVPFLAAGFAVAGALSLAPERVARLYFWDLVGAGLACFIVVPLIWAAGTPVAVGSAAAAFAAAAVLFSTPPSARMLGVAATLAVAGVLVGALVEFTPAKNKFISIHMSIGAEQIFKRWTPINRVDVVAWPDESKQDILKGYRGWGSSKLYNGPGLHYRMIGYDGDSCASMYRWDGRRESIEWFRHHVLQAPYVLRKQPEVMIIGVGGGTDILTAIANDAKRIVGVELNPITIDLGKGPYAEYSGGIFNRPEVTMVAAEGRHYLRSHEGLYDLIEINSVDTLSALSSGAYVLSESYLYTADAVTDYLDHLKPQGIFAMAVGDFDTPEWRPRHTLRLASNVRRALHERGVAQPERHVAVVASNEQLAMAHTLAKNEPFTAEEIAALDAFVAAQDFVYWQRPDRRIDHDVALIYWSSADELESFHRGHELNLRATTDESPFFFNFYKWRSLPRRIGELDAARTFATGQVVLILMLVQSVIFATALILAPLVRLREGLRNVPRRLGYLLYFLALGLGFISLEISFIQRFVLYLGYPTYALSVVLFSLLTFTGAGSFLSGRIRSPERALPVLLLALVLVVAGYLFGLSPIFTATLGAPFAARVVVAVLLLVPMGLVLGMFFPLGITLAARVNPQFVPWAWGINGCATVVGTILAVIVAITFDFLTVSLIALAIYGIGVGGMLWAQAARTA